LYSRLRSDVVTNFIAVAVLAVLGAQLLPLLLILTAQDRSSEDRPACPQQRHLRFKDYWDVAGCLRGNDAEADRPL
jgi:hypothetical protein